MGRCGHPRRDSLLGKHTRDAINRVPLIRISSVGTYLPDAPAERLYDSQRSIGLGSRLFVLANLFERCSYYWQIHHLGQIGFH
jgi:hypothetical protein